MKKLLSLILSLIFVMSLTGCSSQKTGATAVSIAPKQSEGKYAYMCLEDKEKKVYDSMYYTLSNHEEVVQVETLDDEDMKKVFFCVLKDHPEVFWCSSFNRSSTKYTDGSVKTEFCPIYSMTKQERYDYQEKIDKVADSWLAKIPAGADDYTKAKILFDILTTEVDYVSDSEENQNIISTFVNKQTVCQGYAKAFQYLLNKTGVESVLVKGKANGNNHAWNLVKLDGEYYHFDVTWGNPSFADNKPTGTFINYAYFAVTTKEISTNHIIQDDLEFPECTATSDNYFVHEGLYFDKANANIVGDAIYTADANNKSFVSVKFADDTTYNWAINYFVTQRHVFDFYKSRNKLFLHKNDELRVMSLIFS